MMQKPVIAIVDDDRPAREAVRSRHERDCRGHVAADTIGADRSGAVLVRTPTPRADRAERPRARRHRPLARQAAVRDGRTVPMRLTDRQVRLPAKPEANALRATANGCRRLAIDLLIRRHNLPKSTARPLCSASIETLIGILTGRQIAQQALFSGFIVLRHLWLRQEPALIETAGSGKTHPARRARD
jgi:hypothetical protein